MMRAALIGCGGISKVHLSVLNKYEEARLEAVADINFERAKRAAESFNAVPYENWEEMLEKEMPDVLHICTPHYLHVPMALRALSMGINVLIEKPCSITLDGIEELCKAQKESGKQVGICFQNRYNPASRQLFNAVKSEKYGKLLAARAFVTWDRGADYYNADDWHGTLEKEGGGVLVNQAIHTLDLVQWFCGGVRAVSAHSSNDHLQGVIEVEDTIMARLEFAENAGGVFYATTAYYSNAPVFIELQLENALLRMEGEQLFEIDNGTHRAISLENEAEAQGKDYWGSGHAALIEDFYSCVKENRPFEIDAVEGGKAAKAVLKIYESANSGKRELI